MFLKYAFLFQVASLIFAFNVDHARAVGGAPVLTSLPILDELRRNASDTFIRHEGTTVDLLPGDDRDGHDLALCHLTALFPFTHKNDFPWRPAFENVAMVALAAQHLNAGDGSLVPQVAGLNRRCRVRFTTEFSNTELDAATAMSLVVQHGTRQPGTTDRLPCAFIGAYSSSNSIPSSMASGVLGYPQVSGSSSSAQLDDTTQYKLFGRTMPSDQGNTVPFVMFIRNVLNIKHLAIMNVNDGYGNAYAQAMRISAKQHAPDMIIHQIPLDYESESIKAAVTSLKNSKFQFIFALVFTKDVQDALMTEAFNQGVAGTGKHNWLWSGIFQDQLVGRDFEKDSPLYLAYRYVTIT